MASFSLQWRTSTKKDLRKLPREEAERIIHAAEQLAIEPFPHGSEKLAGALDCGDVSPLCSTPRRASESGDTSPQSKARTVEIRRVRHRKDVYR